ncbi:DUF2917 domain-containing protein [Pelomonas saccharophila]|nr:DUF2917 domain-containing protein [Roseateles saccharophilus]
MADCVTKRSAAACVKLRCRAAASKAASSCSGGSRSSGLSGMRWRNAKPSESSFVGGCGEAHYPRQRPQAQACQSGMQHRPPEEHTMLIDVPRTRLLLQRGQTSRLPEANATHLCSAAGTLWVTIDHDARDIVLEPGQCFTVRSDEAVTVSALSGPAVLDLRPAGAPA